MDLKFFDVCSGALIPDVMHDVLEGVLQLELKLVLQHIVSSAYMRVCVSDHIVFYIHVPIT